MHVDGQLLVSLVVPVFNEAEAIPPFLEAVERVMKSAVEQVAVPLEFEYVFVNDGSTDDTLKTLLEERGRNARIQVLDLSRNFGKEAALTAGLEAARGQAVIPIDVDLQDPPELIPELLKRWLGGYEVVLAKRAARDVDSHAKRKMARAFYLFHNLVSEIEIPPDVGDYRLMDRRVVDALATLRESRRFMKGLFAWVGFRSSTIEFTRAGRSAGDTKFSGWALWKLALEGITSFSAAPLVIWSYIGFTVSVVAFMLMIIVLVQRLFFGIDIPGYAALFVAVLFIGGVQLIGIGMLGEYVSRVYAEVKRRPIYIVRKKYGE